MEMWAVIYRNSHIVSPRFLAELRPVLHAGGIQRRALYFGVARRDPGAYSAAYAHVSGNNLAGIPQAQPVQAGH